MRAEQLGVLTALPAGRAEGIEQSLGQSGADVLYVDGTTVVDKITLMTRVAVDLDISADDQPTSWDGLADCLWGVLHRLSADHAVLVWTHADVLVRRSVNDFLQLVNVLTDLARSVATTETGFPRPLKFHVVFLGDDPMFATTD